MFIVLFDVMQENTRLKFVQFTQKAKFYHRRVCSPSIIIPPLLYVHSCSSDTI